MGLFDKMKQAAANVSGNQTVTFTFQALPESLAQMQALPEASLDTPLQDRSPHRLRAVRLRCRQIHRAGDAQLAAGSPPHERAGDFLPERPLPGRQELYPVLLLCGCVAGKRLYPPASPSPCWWAATTPPTWRKVTASCSSPAAAPTAPAPSSCAARATGSGSCGIST